MSPRLPGRDTPAWQLEREYRRRERAARRLASFGPESRAELVRLVTRLEWALPLTPGEQHQLVRMADVRDGDRPAKEKAKLMVALLRGADPRRGAASSEEPEGFREREWLYDQEQEQEAAKKLRSPDPRRGGAA